MPKRNVTDTNYNEPPKKRRPHKVPKGVKPDLRRFPAAGARIAIERLASSLAGIDDAALKRAGITKREMVEHRGSVQSALLHAVKEAPTGRNERIRNASVAYLGELRFVESVELLGGLATSFDETPATRGLAAEALCRIGGDSCATLLRSTLDDPDPTVRERGAKALGIIGRASDGEFLAAVAGSDADPLVRHAANGSARTLLPKARHPQLPKQGELPRSRKTQFVAPEPSIVRPVGRDENKVQPGIPGRRPQPEGDGGLDHVITAQFGDFAQGLVFAQPTYALEQSPVSGHSRLRVVSAGPTMVAADPFAAATERSRLFGEDRFQAPGLADRTFDNAQLMLQPGRRISSMDGRDRTELRGMTFVPNIDASPVITDLGPDVPTVWRGKPFGVSVSFEAPGRQLPVWLKLAVQLPGANWEERWFAVSTAQQTAGRVDVRGFQSNESGRIRIVATLYGSDGGTTTAESQHVAFTPNPHSVSIVPQTRGTNGEGPAHYNSAEDKFFCHATCTFTNGHPFPITVGPDVTCTVTDGGDHVATFGFTIGTHTVSAQSSRVLGIFTSHGSSSDIYDVFKDFGDVTIDFEIETNQGSVSDSNVWAAMASIELALNFVGSMSSSTRSTFQSVVETEASAIFEQQSLYIPNTQRFLLSSTHADWSRYRDIEMDDNKDSDCTAGSDEADDLRDDWSSPTDLLDIWIVESFSGPACAANVGGFSPVDGPTSKGGSRSGLLIQLAGINLSTTSGRDLMGIVVAHEVGHFLGLNHSTTNDNFMEASVGTANSDITHGQYRDMADHGFVGRFVP